MRILNYEILENKISEREKILEDGDHFPSLGPGLILGCVIVSVQAVLDDIN